MYEYKAILRRVIDGDTLEVDIDLGFKTILKKEKLRLLGIDTPELRSQDVEERVRAKAAKEYVQSLLAPGDEFVLQTEKDRAGKYGRYLARVWIKVEDGGQKSLAHLLKENNHEK